MIAAGMASLAPSHRQIGFTTWDSITNTNGAVKKAMFSDLAEALVDPEEQTSKGVCKLIKLATFTKGCKADDLQSIEGLEGDYDGGKVSIDTAAQLLTQAGVEAFLYTSASHTTAAPRWRVLAPLSRPHTVAEHGAAMALLNGALGGILAPESFDASRRYFYGKVTGVPYRSCQVQGQCVDQLDLIIDPIGKVGATAINKSSGAAPDDLTRLVTLQSATADTVQELKSALAGMSKKRADDRGDWINVIHALASLKGTDFESDAYELACEFSARSDKFDPEDLECKWAGVTPTSITYKSIFSMAQADGWINPRTTAPVVQVATAESVAAAPITARRFARVSMATFIDRKPPAWRIKGLLPNDGVALIYGASGSGKSFFCIDVAMTIARGETWRDFATKQGAVTYVCAEGASDFAKRLTAYAAHRGDGPFDVIDAAPNLLIKVDVEALIAELMLAPVAVVFLDTLACLSVGGDENSAKDMGILLDHCKLIGRMTGALVVLVHHTGKSGDGPRGSSALIAAVDTSIEISRAGDDRVAKVVKLKGGKDGQEFGFKLITVAAGVNEDGDEESSCVVEQTAAVPKAQRVQEPKGTNQKIVMRVLQQAFELTGEGMFVNDLAEAAARELLHDPSAKRDTRKQKCMDAIEGLLGANRLVKENELLIPA